MIRRGRRAPPSGLIVAAAAPIARRGAARMAAHGEAARHVPASLATALALPRALRQGSGVWPAPAHGTTLPLSLAAIGIAARFGVRIQERSR